MRTYILNTLNRYRQFSENSDVKVVLCNKSWRLFNDTGEQELYIFQNNGTIFYSVNGQVISGTWQYLSANQSLIITVQNQSYMLHPAFIDTVILALQLDGTQKYLFMIDEKDSYSYQLKTLNDIEGYFIEKEKKVEENRKLLQQQAEERHREEQRQAWERQCQIEEQRQLREEAEVEWKKQKEYILRKKRPYLCLFKLLCWLLIFLLVGLIVAGFVCDFPCNILDWVNVLLLVLLFFCFICWLFKGATFDINDYLHDSFVSNYNKTQHSNHQ